MQSRLREHDQEPRAVGDRHDDVAKRHGATLYTNLPFIIAQAPRSLSS